MPRYKTRHEKRWRRHLRVRRKIFGTADRPRVCVFRSLRHIYCQAIDDVRGVTISAASTLEKDLRKPGHNATIEDARQVGERLAERLLALGITQVVFDRGGFRYHGQVKALCEGLRSKGIKV